MARKKKLGIGAKCSIKNKYLHPKKLVADQYPNQTAQSELEDCVCIKKGVTAIRRKEVDVVYFRHDDFPNKELYCVPRWVRVTEEGAAAHFFDGDGDIGNQGEGGDANAQEEEAPEEIPHEVLNAGNHAEDIALVQAMGFMVDNDNEPAPENVPQQGGNNANEEEQTWGWTGADQRKLFGAQDH